MRGGPTRVVGRLVAAAATLALAAILVSAAADALADPAAMALGAGAPPAEVERLRAAWGLDRPWALRLGERLGGLLVGDLGSSRVRGAPVAGLVAAALPPSLAYALPGTLLATLLGVTGGLAAARRRGGAVDRLLVAGSTALMSVASVVLVVLVHQVLAFRLGLFPLVGWPLAGSEEAWFGYAILPALVWALCLVGPEVRHYRAIFVAGLAAPHLDGLRARGIGEGAILVHAMRGAAAPVLARVVSRVPPTLAGGVVVEYVFNIPGLGGLTIAAVKSGDLDLLAGIAVAVAAVTIVAEAAADLLAARLDPRLAAGEGA